MHRPELRKSLGQNWLSEMRRGVDSKLAMHRYRQILSKLGEGAVKPREFAETQSHLETVEAKIKGTMWKSHVRFCPLDKQLQVATPLVRANAPARQTANTIMPSAAMLPPQNNQVQPIEQPVEGELHGVDLGQGIAHVETETGLVPVRFCAITIEGIGPNAFDYMHTQDPLVTMAAAQ